VALPSALVPGVAVPAAAGVGVPTAAGASCCAAASAAAALSAGACAVLSGVAESCDADLPVLVVPAVDEVSPVDAAAFAGALPSALGEVEELDELLAAFAGLALSCALDEPLRSLLARSDARGAGGAASCDDDGAAGGGSLAGAALICALSWALTLMSTRLEKSGPEGCGALLSAVFAQLGASEPVTELSDVTLNTGRPRTNELHGQSARTGPLPDWKIAQLDQWLENLRMEPGGPRGGLKSACRQDLPPRHTPEGFHLRVGRPTFYKECP
jgi:hypothetical protein